MALHQFLSSSPMTHFTKQVSFSLEPSFVPRVVKAKGIATMSSNTTIVRRSANFHPSIWKNEFIQSLSSEFMGETYVDRFNMLKKEVEGIMNHIIDDPLKQLDLIDTLQRLGISYHFENEIKGILERRYRSDQGNNSCKKIDVYATALEFRLMRQHGFSVSPEVFNNFKDRTSHFSTYLCVDIKGMMSLYEASFLSIEGENILEDAKNFTTNCLEKYITSSRNELDVAIVRHALELPLHWRVPRLEARWFIDIYERKAHMNPILLEIAKLDFNMVQSIHQEDLKYASKWWRSIGIAEKLSFARDRLMESFMWTVGIGFQPELGYFRRMSTKVNALITVIDDVYDVYGTLEELELFTNVVEKWDIVAMEQLPDYMKLCFLALYNTINDMTFELLRDKGVNVIQCLKKSWVDLCKSYMLEAKWYHNGYKPTLQEYLDNAWVSISGTVILVHAYVLATSPMVKDDLESLENNIDIFRWSSTILRLADDLGTSSDEQIRGDVPKSIQCYMNDTGASEVDARKHIKYLIDETWKKLNKVAEDNSVFSQLFVEMAKNVSRTAQCMYQYGDGHTIEHQETKDRVVSLLIQPIPTTTNITCDNIEKLLL
ncbi:terpene synthase 10-like [Momordica charantia]|uniref:Terpene synthase 10-like n=1 Tax=Momordica charantia TaxID=3673 RepID=A0A6J1DKS9_MOMCH|nr:terpene synthase 10-like [Momordica charantia]